MTAQSAITRFRRDLMVGALIKIALGTAAIGCGVLGWVAEGLSTPALLAVVGAVWLVLGINSAKSSRLAVSSTPLIATGQFEEAERQIDQAMRSFSLFRASKLLSLHHLALLRHAQRRWPESAVLSRAVLGQRLGPLEGLNKQSRIILAEALLEMGDLWGAYESLAALYIQRLTLNEAMKLLAVQTDYEARVGAWAQMVPPPTGQAGPAGGAGGMFAGAGPAGDPTLAGLATKVQLAELMPSADAARVQALLALAAKKVGRPDWSDWLRRRAELLADVGKLTSDRPMLWELWSAPSPAPTSTPPAAAPDPTAAPIPPGAEPPAVAGLPPSPPDVNPPAQA